MLVPLLKHIVLLTICSSLIACSVNKGTDYSTQTAQQLKSLQLWQKNRKTAKSTTLLQDLVSSNEIDYLINKALKSNPSIHQTRLAVEIAKQSVSDVSSARFPQVSLNLNQKKLKGGDTTYTSNLSADWTIDWHGKLKDSIDAQHALFEKTIWADRYSKDLLVATIINTALQVTNQIQLISIERDRLVALKQNESTIVERYQKGLGDLTALDTARSSSASSQALLSAYTEKYHSLTRAVALLIGEHKYQINGLDDYPSISVPINELPEQNLGRRPDIQQAFLDIRVADLNSAIAYKNLLPSLSLRGVLSDSSTSLQDSLFTNPAWTLLGNITAPLFQGGKLKAKAKAADLTAEQSFWAYQEKLLVAVKEVDDALGQEKALKNQKLFIEDALANAKRSYQTYQTKYRQGLVSFIDLLGVQAKTFDLKAQQSNITYQHLSNRISLGLALGFGAEK